MTFREWLEHLWIWIRMFPAFSEDTHAYVRALGDPLETCMGCGRSQMDPEFDLEADKRIMKRYPTDEEGQE